MPQRIADRAERAGNRRVEMLVGQVLAVLDQAKRGPSLVPVQREQYFVHVFGRPPGARALDSRPSAPLPPCYKTHSLGRPSRIPPVVGVIREVLPDDAAEVL